MTFQPLAKGWAGVDLFFILSGFILMYAHGNDFRIPSSSALIRFAKSRVIRVYPLNWAVLIIIGAVSVIDPVFWAALQNWSIEGRPAEAFIRTALLGTRWLPGVGDWNQPTWSLSAEIVGYVAFPFLAYGFARASRFYHAVAYAAAALLFLMLFHVITDTVTKNDLGITSSLTRMSLCFISGVALARAKVLAPPWIDRHAGCLSLAAALLIAPALISWKGSLVMPVLFSAIIFLLSFRKGPVNHFCSLGVITFLGRISFSLYLVHVQILVLLEIHILPRMAGSSTLAGAAVLGGYIAFTLFVSWLLYSCIERPCHRFAQSIAKPKLQSHSPQPI